MESLENIVEQTFEVSSNCEVVRELFPSVKNPKSFDYAYVVYVDNGEKILLLGWLGGILTESSDKYNFKRELKTFLRKNPAYSLLDLVYFVDIYRYSVFLKRDIKYQYKFRRYEIADDILADSKGLLLWHYQLENLFRMFYSSPERFIEMRKGINNSIWEETKSLRLSSDLTLYDILCERMIFGCTSFPPFKAAFNLLNIVKKSTIESKP